MDHTTNGNGTLKIGIDVEEMKARSKAAKAKQAADTIDEAVVTYDVLRGFELAHVLVPVKCAVPGYEALTLYYRTSNASKRRREKPFIQDPPELAALKVKQKALPDDTPDEERLEVATEVLAAQRAYNSQVNDEMNRWLSMFLIKIEPKITLYGKEMPELDHNDLATYQWLADEMEPVYLWAIEEGYQAALREQAGNSSGSLKQPTLN